MKILATSSFLVTTALVLLIAVILRYPFKFDPGERLFSAEELALCNGTDEKLPILLGILGSVFDVTKGKSHYGAGGGYNHFAGRDASRAFVSGNFTVNTAVRKVEESNQLVHSTNNQKELEEWFDSFWVSLSVAMYRILEGMAVNRKQIQQQLQPN